MPNVESLIRRPLETNLNFVSLFCGAGGMDLGFYRAGFNPSLSIDNNKDAIDTYSSLFKNHNVYCADLETFKFNSSADLVIGGPPCQGFSVAGYANPEDPRSKHILTFMRIVKKANPRVFVMENVKALAMSEKWSENRKKLMNIAKQMGYDAKFFVLNSSDYGVPQNRERMFFIGVKGENRLEFKPPVRKGKQTVRSTLLQLPEYGQKGNNTRCVAKIVLAKKPVIRGGAYSGMFFNGKGRVLNLDKPSLTLPASMGGNHTPIIDQSNLEDSTQPNWAEGCFNKLIKGKEVKRVPKRLRRLTVEEAAAIQSFPKNMLFKGSVSSQFKQIGNAVPPLLSYHVAKEIREQIFLQ